jgi:hypothetical protein
MAVIDTPTTEQWAELDEAARAEQVYWEEHFPEFLERYPEQFVAVRESEVVAVSPDLLLLVGILEGKELKPTEVWVRFITADPAHILH